MVTFAHILLLVFVLMTINSGVKDPLDKLTMYKKSDLTNQPAWFIVLFAFFGVLMLLFYKPIRQFRKEYYIKNKIKMYEFWNLQHNMFPPPQNSSVSGTVWPEFYEMDSELHEEYLNNKRYLKLISIQRKTKRNGLLGRIGL